MVGITRDDLWYVISSSGIKDKTVFRFLENKHKLDETISKLKSDSKNLGNKIIDEQPDNIIARLTEIDGLIRSIEKGCKEGMNVCKEKRQLERYKENVSNIDKVYTILNDVLKGINVVCKNIQDEFKTIKKSLWGKHYHSIQMFVNILGFSLDDEDVEVAVLKFQRELKGGITGGSPYYACLKTMLSNDSIKSLLFNCAISDREIVNWNNEGKPSMKRRIKSVRNIEKEMFNTLRKEFPAHKNVFDSLNNLATQQLDLIEALSDVPVKDTLDKPIEQIPAAMKLKEFSDNFDNSLREIADKFFN
jgi:hypothetical protein